MSFSERILHGITVSSGAAIGHAVRAFDPLFISLNLRISSDDVAGEVARFRASVEKSSGQLRRMQAQLKRRNAEESSFLIDAHLLILQDRLFVDRIIAKIESDRINAEWAIQQVTDDLCEAYDRLEDDYLRERRGDLDDIVRRLLHNLQSKHMPQPGCAPPLPTSACQAPYSRREAEVGSTSMSVIACISSASITSGSSSLCSPPRPNE